MGLIHLPISDAQHQIFTAAALIAARRPQCCYFPALVLAKRLCSVYLCDGMAVDRVQRVSSFREDAFPVATVLDLAVNRVTCDTVAMHYWYFLLWSILSSRVHIPHE